MAVKEEKILMKAYRDFPRWVDAEVRVIAARTKKTQAQVVSEAVVGHYKLKEPRKRA